MVRLMTHRKIAILTLLLTAVCISACGYKAPVYYPSPEQKKALDEKEARIKARKQTLPAVQ